ncbi:Mur ligase central domain protein [Bacteriovorax sp. BAL6_X]|uniref:Mur ligase central domain protein n=1 Tax=Bacteriovorax sp. BAL6_X TaxID=1201290 RepID=UPI000385FC6C|nr:Mur ligase central domain protein [Bacteriovorax sp. BAL6_X]EPZ50842.1 Mur ligase central domain protein [Bacteriovorax sp. BAL6_X]
MNNIDTFHCQKLESTFLTRLTQLCGKESFRPKLDHIRDYLVHDRRVIESRSKVIIVGGTNGKGETCHSLSYLYKRAGFTSCLWTSPHVLSITERFKINEKNISIEELTELLNEHEEVIKDLKLSFYEALFVLFIKFSLKHETDFVILEVGLGGRFDATNIFTRPVAAITSIGLDHTEILGSTLKEILFEKYGITRMGGKLLENVEQTFLKDILSQWCGRDDIALTSVTQQKQLAYFEKNRQMAIALYQESTGRKLDEEGISKIEWPVTPGRWDRLSIEGRDFVFVGAHNQLGHKELLKSISDCQGQELYDVLISFSSGREAQIKSTLKLYETYPCVIKSINVLSYEHERALSKETLQQNLKTGTKVYELHNFLDTILSTNEEIDAKKQSNIESLRSGSNKILVVGSYYFIACMQKYLRSKFSK